MRIRMLGCLVVSVLLAASSGCGLLSGQRDEDDGGQQVPLSEVPEPARIVIERLTAGGQIKMLEREEVAGQVVYDVEARVGGKDVECDIASDGTVLATEESVAYDSLPEAVKAVSRKYFAPETELRASKEVEGNQTFYEVEGRQGDAVVTMKLTDTGRIIEIEKERS